jgi:2-oxoglutarate dehydrogenase E1 component
LYDTQTGKSADAALGPAPANHPAARFDVFDSSLSEEGVLGFEYGYSVVCSQALVLWEAQFGDFGNGAQTIIDQYIAASEDKWKQTSRLVMLLPHGYEGQGPEHSSARLERYLQLCAENNLTVCNPTTPAQYYHLLRRQIRPGFERPLIVMTPKSLLRLPAATSTVDQLTGGGFQPVIDDSSFGTASGSDRVGDGDRSRIQRVVLCSGKVYYDLAEARTKSGADNVAILRLEQFYPFPGELLGKMIASYPRATELVWAQEEPKNMGGWTFMEPRSQHLPRGRFRPRYASRAASASPATTISYSSTRARKADRRSPDNLR